MTDQTAPHRELTPPALPGLAPEATPLVGVGLGLTGLLLGVRPRLAAIPLAFTALAALLFRDPQRTTPDTPTLLYAPADGTITGLEEQYEHRYLHTDALTIRVQSHPFDVAVIRAPLAGTVQYLAYTDHGSTLSIGLATEWGPMLLVARVGFLSRHIIATVAVGDSIEAGERLGNAPLHFQTDLLMQRDSMHPFVQIGQHVKAGESRIAHITPL